MTTRCVMRMPRPFAPLLYSIGVPIIPAHVLETALRGRQVQPYLGHQHAAGQRLSASASIRWRVTSQAADSSISAAIRDYWMHDEQGEQLPRLHGETLQIVPDGNAQYLRFLAGQIDVYTPRPEEVVDLREQAEATRHHAQGNRYRHRLAVLRLQPQPAPLRP